MDLTAKLEQAWEKINQAENILLVTHERPDGDALSSLCTMIEIVSTLKKKYTAYCHDKPGDNFSFLPNIKKITNDKIIDFSLFDLIIILDCGSQARTKLSAEIKTKRSEQYIIELDHHPKIEDYAELEIRCPTASATSEILYDFIKTNKIKITKNIATCILTGILTDTANFFFPNTTNKTLNIGSEMLLYGAKFPEIVKNTWRNKSLSAVKLWGQVLNNLTINEKYNIAFSVIKKDDIAKYNVDSDALDSIVGFMSNLQGVKFILFLREEDDGKLKGNLRTADPMIDVSKLASCFGGGGHTKASGFIVDGQLSENNGQWKVI